MVRLEVKRTTIEGESVCNGTIRDVMYHYRRREGSVMVRLEVKRTTIEGERVSNGTIRDKTYHYRRRESQ
jgi:hypothetical protein